jgi:cytochrome c oxidase assembly factor CtaG
MPELGIVMSLVGAAVLYGLLRQRQWSTAPHVQWSETLAFLAGLAVVAVALVSPLDGAAHRSLWVHMVQHVLLISLAAPLLAIGRPLTLGARWLGLPMPFADRQGAAWALLAAATGVQVVTLVVWHIPALYDAALSHDPLHGAEHVTLLLTATALWVALVEFDGDQGGAAVAALFIASFPPMVLGFSMTFARSVWYPSNSTSGHDALGDQQLAGVIMWAYGGLAAVAGGVYLFVRWLQQLEHLAPGRPAGAGDVPDGRMPSC